MKTKLLTTTFAAVAMLFAASNIFAARPANTVHIDIQYDPANSYTAFTWPKLPSGDIGSGASPYSLGASYGVMLLNFPVNMQNNIIRSQVQVKDSAGNEKTYYYAFTNLAMKMLNGYFAKALYCASSTAGCTPNANLPNFNSFKEAQHVKIHCKALQCTTTLN